MTKDDLIRIIKEEIDLEQYGYMNSLASITGIDGCAEKLYQIVSEEKKKEAIDFFNWITKEGLIHYHPDKTDQLYSKFKDKQ